MAERIDRFVPASELEPIKTPLIPLVQQILRSAMDGKPFPGYAKPETPLSDYHFFLCDRGANQARTFRLRFSGDTASLPLAQAVQGELRPEDLHGQFNVYGPEEGEFKFGREGCYVKDGTRENCDAFIQKLTEQQRLITEGTQVDWRGETMLLSKLVMSHFWQRFDRLGIIGGPFETSPPENPPLEYVYPSIGFSSAWVGVYDW